MSRVSRFGRNHIGEVAPAPGISLASETAKTGDDAELYEWNCPFQGTWNETRFSSGNGEEQCKDDSDCLCVQRGSPNAHTEFRKGEELIVGDFQTASGKKGGGTELRTLQVVPHYRMRDFTPDYVKTSSSSPQVSSSHQHADAHDGDNLKLDLESQNERLGSVQSFDHSHWLERYKDNAERIQFGLDSYHDAIEKSFQEHARPAAEAAPEQSDDIKKVSMDLLKIRRFSVLSNECVNMRDTVAKLAPKPASESFASTFKNCESCPEQQLKCFKEEDKCRQLNCYVGFHAEPFLQRMQQLKTKLMAQVPEQDAPVDDSKEERRDETSEATAEQEEDTDISPEENQQPDTDVAAGDNLDADQPGSASKTSSLGTDQVIATALLPAGFSHARPTGNQRATSRHARGLDFL